MEIFTKPVNLNGAELREELRASGVEIGDEFDTVKIDENGSLVLDIASKDKEKALTIVEAHNGTTTPPEPSLAEKLASVGVSIEELKAALA